MYLKLKVVNDLSKLVIIGGDQAYSVPFSGETYLVYLLGVAPVHGKGIVSVNNPEKLHKIAEEIRDDYTRWIYSLNQTFLRRGLVYRGLSLFLVSDCSCKRTEFFETYSFICNLLLIKEIIEQKSPSEVAVVGVDPVFIQGLRSIAGGIPIRAEGTKGKNLAGIRRIVSDLRFVIELALIVTLKTFLGSSTVERGQKARRFFFTIFPKMIDTYGRDGKYGELFQDEDRYAASIITDGLHQHVSITSYFRLRRKARDQGLVLIDDFLGHSDWVRVLYWLVRIRWALFNDGTQHQFMGINVANGIRLEFAKSTGRLARFMGIKGAFERFFNNYPVKEFIYYLPEYPLGRLISWMLGTQHPGVVSSGFQHGPAAWRKLVCFMSPEETSIAPDYLVNVAVPNRMFVEDEASAAIYHYSGYPNVRVMNEVYRLRYLRKIQPQKDSNWVLIAPGLHDGENMLRVLSQEIQQNSPKGYFVKPHPLANNEYLSRFDYLSSLHVTDEPIECLLEKVGEVYVTYSSVGHEARTLGITVRVIDIPGVINQSPLLDGIKRIGSPYAAVIPH